MQRWSATAQELEDEVRTWQEVENHLANNREMYPMRRFKAKMERMRKDELVVFLQREARSYLERKRVRIEHQHLDRLQLPPDDEHAIVGVRELMKYATDATKLNYQGN